MSSVRRRIDSRFKVSVRADERTAIEERARAAGLSVSAYLRVSGLNQEPRSVLDHDAVLRLAQVNADQGRLGGLLKLWLSERPGVGASVQEVRRVLHQIEAFQKDLKATRDRL
jgi:hypothetical protein